MRNQPWQIDVQIVMTPEAAMWLHGAVVVASEGNDEAARVLDPLVDALEQSIEQFEKTGDPRKSRALVLLHEEVGREDPASVEAG